MTRLTLDRARVTAIAVVLFAASQIGMWYYQKNHTDEQSRQICGVLQVLTPRPGDPQPTNERSRLIVDRSKRAYAGLGCHE